MGTFGYAMMTVVASLSMICFLACLLYTSDAADEL